VGDATWATPTWLFPMFLDIIGLDSHEVPAKNFRIDQYKEDDQFVTPIDIQPMRLVDVLFGLDGKAYPEASIIYISYPLLSNRSCFYLSILSYFIYLGVFIVYI
jgi:hypothetical protein